MGKAGSGMWERQGEASVAVRRTQEAVCRDCANQRNMQARRTDCNGQVCSANAHALRGRGNEPLSPCAETQTFLEPISLTHGTLPGMDYVPLRVPEKTHTHTHTHTHCHTGWSTY